MADQQQRIEFGNTDPYLFDVIDAQVEGMLLEEHEVCLLRFGQLYLPVDLPACAAVAEALTNMSQSAKGPELAGMLPLEFDLAETTELPLLTAALGTSHQHNETVFLDVLFGETEARLCFSILTAAQVGELLSQVPQQE